MIPLITITYKVIVSLNNTWILVTWTFNGETQTSQKTWNTDHEETTFTIFNGAFVPFLEV